MIDWAAPIPDRDTALAKVKAELRAEQRRLTDAEVDLIANAAIELRMPRQSVSLSATWPSSQGREDRAM